MSNGILTGYVEVRLENHGANNERHIHLSISGLPGWLLGMIRDAGPLTMSGCGGTMDHPDKTGPQHVSFHAERVFVSAPESKGERTT